ncbi:hypothetical protein SAMD00019534_051820 [Acytostelium subglobosum LB1]|uniref:hypothetical protein n=1 Tax=Acytostelium subglobosum LB1 TaxID=1410327 RepID=UPI000645004C|nr:hypothetical protein SAMD00019534_051820 [Acytostelium subglobosum LB1]GAM22007.1 hypothetical protein SAMD00019534_051820 [Acytostelium subglobosum LB1]|eukprot:XP_012755107.1 hypothetical protein SAMD00019534_051820 [Acytostelium subglobosum LB1]
MGAAATSANAASPLVSNPLPSSSALSSTTPIDHYNISSPVNLLHGVTLPPMSEPPPILLKFIRFLLVKGVALENIFVQQPSDSLDIDVQQCKKKLLKEMSITNDIEQIQLSSFTNSPFVVAEMLKQYLLSLSEPLFSFQLYDSFLLTHTILSHQDRLWAYRFLLAYLPQGFRTTIKAVLDLLWRVHCNSSQTKLDAQSLAAIFTGAFLRPEEEIYYMKQDRINTEDIVRLWIDEFESVTKSPTVPTTKIQAMATPFIPSHQSGSATNSHGAASGAGDSASPSSTPQQHPTIGLNKISTQTQLTNATNPQQSPKLSLPTIPKQQNTQQTTTIIKIKPPLQASSSQNGARKPSSPPVSPVSLPPVLNISGSPHKESSHLSPTSSSTIEQSSSSSANPQTPTSSAKQESTTSSPPSIANAASNSLSPTAPQSKSNNNNNNESTPSSISRRSSAAPPRPSLPLTLSAFDLNQGPSPSKGEGETPSTPTSSSNNNNGPTNNNNNVGSSPSSVTSPNSKPITLTLLTTLDTDTTEKINKIKGTTESLISEHIWTQLRAIAKGIEKETSYGVTIKLSTALRDSKRHLVESSEKQLNIHKNDIKSFLQQFNKPPNYSIHVLSNEQLANPPTGVDELKHFELKRAAHMAIEDLSEYIFVLKTKLHTLLYKEHVIQLAQIISKLKSIVDQAMPSGGSGGQDNGAPSSGRNSLQSSSSSTSTSNQQSPLSSSGGGGGDASMPLTPSKRKSYAQESRKTTKEIVDRLTVMKKGLEHASLPEAIDIGKSIRSIKQILHELYTENRYQQPPDVKVMAPIPDESQLTTLKKTLDPLLERIFFQIDTVSKLGTENTFTSDRESVNISEKLMAIKKVLLVTSSSSQATTTTGAQM